MTHDVASMSGRATGHIEVQTYEPQTYDGSADGPDLIEIHVTETFTGDIAGEGRARFLQTMRKDGSASFVGVERVSGIIAGRRGTFVLQDTGVLEGTTVTGQWFVVPGSGGGELVGLRGEGGFSAELGQHAVITLDYRFES
jgi:Protein of unknown function (DUF3224)